MNVTDVDNLLGRDVLDELTKARELSSDVIATLVFPRGSFALFIRLRLPHVDRLAQLLRQRHHVVYDACRQCYFSYGFLIVVSK